MANEIINPSTSGAKLLEDVVNDVTPDLCYLKELASQIYDTASDQNNTKLEALTFALGICAENALTRLSKFVDDAISAEEKKVSHA
jgi:hypothetical protein